MDFVWLVIFGIVGFVIGIFGFANIVGVIDAVFNFNSISGKLFSTIVSFYDTIEFQAISQQGDQGLSLYLAKEALLSKTKRAPVTIAVWSVILIGLSILVGLFAPLYGMIGWFGAMAISFIAALISEKSVRASFVRDTVRDSMAFLFNRR